MNSHHLKSELLCIGIAGVLTCGLAWGQSKPLRVQYHVISSLR